MGVATLLILLQPAVVALPHRLDGGGQSEDHLLAGSGLATAAGSVEQPTIQRPRPAIAGILASGERCHAVSARCQTRHRLPVDDELGVHRRLADPVLLERLLPVATE